MTFPDKKKKTEEKTVKPEGKGKMLRRTLRILSWFIALVPVITYLILLPHMPEMLPVKADDMGIPNIEVSKTSFDMIIFTFEGLCGVLIMYFIGYIASGVASRTYRDKSQAFMTQNTVALITLVIAILLNMSWFLTVIPAL